MNKDDYLKELTRLLWKLPKDERDDVVSDYHEHFIIGIEKGRSEEENCKGAGESKNVAKQINAEYMVKKAENKQSAIAYSICREEQIYLLEHEANISKIAFFFLL